MKTKNIKQEKGITLIALVITIIVLLILAGVAISMLSGENGILNKAAEAKTETENAEQKEEVSLSITEGEMRKVINENNDEEVSINNQKTTFKDAMKQIKDIDYEDENFIYYNKLKDMEKAVEEAKNKNQIIKLNQNVYVYDKIEMNEEKTVVIDLNGFSLIFMGSEIGYYNNSVYTYVIDTSTNNTGKIIMWEERDNYKYKENVDINKDGVICQKDCDIINNNYNKKKDDKNINWDDYKQYDVNGDGILNADDEGYMVECCYLHHFASDTWKNWFIDNNVKKYTRCGCNE